MRPNDLENLGPTARLQRESDKTTDLLRQAYVRLMACHPDFCGRNTADGQSLLCDLRDAIVEATGGETQEVQESCEEEAIKLYKAEEERWAAFRANKCNRIAESLMDQYEIGHWETYELIHPSLKELATDIEIILKRADQLPG